MLKEFKISTVCGDEAVIVSLSDTSSKLSIIISTPFVLIPSKVVPPSVFLMLPFKLTLPEPEPKFIIGFVELPESD